LIAADHAFAKRILRLIPINSLDARLQTQALAQGDLLEFRKKKTVFEIGARDPHTFYLLDGELELRAKESSPVRMHAGDENALRALSQLQPRRYTAVAVTPVSVFRIERAVLDNILADEQVLQKSGANMDVREIEDDEDDDSDWMTRLLSSELFTRLPHENIQRFFTELVPLDAKKDDVVVEQGTPGDFLYIVAEGRCAVVRRAPGGGQETQLAILTEGDTFGEEALISNSPRNASVRMTSDGMLMRLPKAAFQELIGNPTLKAVPWSSASKLAEDGATWVDVRFADEHKADGIEGSINVPLNNLRQQATSLDRDNHYIVYCDSGARSSAGAFLLARLGFDACYLAGGLERSPLGQTAKAPPAEPVTSDAGDIAAAAGPAFEISAGDDGAEVTDGDDAGSGQETAAAIDTTTSPPVATGAGTTAAAAAPSPAATASTPMPAAGEPATGAAQHPQMARARAALASLKAERDKTAAYAQKVTDAARELKRRNDELNKVAHAERDRREQLDKELAAARADAGRQASMEQTRLSSELDKAAKRIESLQLERDQARQQASDELTQVRAQLDESDSRVAAALKDKEQADAKHAAAETAWQDSLQDARKEATTAQGLVAGIEKDLDEARERITGFETNDRDQAEQLLTESSRIEDSLKHDQTRIEEERKQFEDERAQFDAETEQVRKDHDMADARVREERAGLEKEIADARTRTEELNQRESELDDARNSVDETLQQRETALAERDAGMAEREQALSEEKALWQETVDKAIGDERDRLQSEQARFREETQALTEERVQTLLEEKTQELVAAHEEQTQKLVATHEGQTQELVAAHEEHETQMRGQVESHVAKLLGEFDTRLEGVRNDYETRLNEQEAMLEDERRRLESEVVHLREALTDVRQTPTVDVREVVLDVEIPQPTVQKTDALTLDLELEEATGTSEAVSTAVDLELDIDGEEAAGADQSVSTAVDLELDLEIDEVGAKPDADARPPAAVTPEVPAIDMPDVPLIEMPEETEETAEEESESESRLAEKRARVISASQLADIRARMQEKMRAAKSKAG